MLDITTWPGDVDSFVDAMVWLVGRMLSNPKHFYRSYTTQELDRIMTARPASSTGVRAREMNLYRRYFDLVAAGRKPSRSASSTPTCVTSRPSTTSGSSAAATTPSPASNG